MGFLNHEKVLKIFERSSIAVACSRWEEPFGEQVWKLLLMDARIITNKIICQKL